MAERQPKVLRGRNIVCLATQAWDEHWTPVQQVMVRLAPRNRVLYVEPFHPPFRRPGTPGLREVEPNLLLYRPRYPYLPFHLKSRVTASINSRMYKAEIAALLSRLKLARPLLWAFFAQSPRVLDLEFEHIIYDCVDDWPSFFPHPRERDFVSRVDALLSERADLIFVGSDPLKEKKADFSTKTFVVNHAADVELFGRACDPVTPIPTDLERVPGPRVGFVGMIDPVRFDFDLIRRIAEEVDCRVVICGGLRAGAEKLMPRHPNIHLLGMKTLEELPGYLKGFDVCLMPYSINEATRTIYPLKLYEYMATGKPIVATAIPSVEPLRELVHVADTPDAYIQMVRLALAEKNAGLQRDRRDRARLNSWETHVARKMEIIGSHLPE